MDDPSVAARLRLDRLMAERAQMHSRARAVSSAAARQTYSCRLLELVDEVNAAIAAVNDRAAWLTRPRADRPRPPRSGAPLVLGKL